MTELLFEFVETSEQTKMEGENKTGEMSEEEIDYNVMGTFPASNPPSWTLGVRLRKKQVTEFEGEKISAVEPSHENELVASNSSAEIMKLTNSKRGKKNYGNGDTTPKSKNGKRK
jgi:hypothetical protein